MSTDNKIFSRSANPNNDGHSSIGMSINRPQWDEYAQRDLNTYRNFNPIGLITEPIAFAPSKEGLTKEEYAAEEQRATPFNGIKDQQFEGRHSLFNAVNAVGNNLEYQINMNAPLLDTPKMRNYIRQLSDCSVKALVDASARGEMGRAVYSYADFMFCKHLGRISNNYLITLRRFPFPAGDHINYTLPGRESNKHRPDIGRLVTWMGTPGNDMSGILKFSVNLPYKDMKAKIQDASSNADNAGGFLGGLFQLGSSSYQQQMLNGTAGNAGLHFIQTAATPIFGSNNFTAGLAAPPNNSWAYHRDENKVYGPVDTITDTMYRQGPEDGGIKFEQDITLTFDYEMRSFDGINTRAAFLDLLANVLAVTFTNATYWGGAVRGSGAAQSNVFANLPIFHMSPENMTFTGLTDAIFKSVGQTAAYFNDGVMPTDLESAIKALTNMARGIFTGLTAGVLNALGRPAKNGLNSLLNFAPQGMWHLTIGNPKHPIMSMGNMVLTNCTVEHYGPLGLDDFPTGLKVVITLKHGTPRDNMRIENMYMNGDWRIYQPLGNRAYIAWQTAEEIGNWKEEDNVTNELVEKVAKMNEEYTDTELAAIKKNTTDKLLMKYFGTIDKQQIIEAAKEGYLGSQPRKKPTKEEQDAAQAAWNKKEGIKPEKGKKGKRK